MLAALLAVGLVASVHALSPLVQTTTGLVDGVVVGDVIQWLGKAARAQDYPGNTHTGIPYASPPTGALRFQQSVAAEPWPGVLDASTPPPACPQVCELTPGACANATNEMCLYLNVNSPSNASNLPVMVWIHGGLLLLLLLLIVCN